MACFERMPCLRALRLLSCLFIGVFYIGIRKVYLQFYILYNITMRQKLNLNSSSEPFLTQEEASRMSVIRPEAIERFLQLRADNLFSHREAIVGFRTDDLLSVLEHLDRGFFPISNSSMMDKEGEALYFLTANPDCTTLQQQGFYSDIQWDPGHAKTLEGAIDRNQEQYDQMAIQLAIFKNIGDVLLPHRQQIAEDMQRYAQGVHAGEREQSQIEKILESLANDALKLTSDGSWRRAGCSAVPSLKRVLDHDSFTAINHFLARLQDRGSVLVAFNANVLKGDYVTSAKGQDYNEITVDHPEKKIGIDCVLGYEVLGDWEDQVCDHLSQQSGS